MEATNETELNQALGNAKVVLDFWAPWCGPCKVLAAALDRAKPILDARDIALVKINVEDAPQLAERFGVRSLPTVILLQDQNVIHTHVGALDAQRLGAALDLFK